MNNAIEGKPKLWVFSNIAFNKYMEDNGWNDENIPPNSAFVSICTPNWIEEGEGHWFSDGLKDVINLDFDDIDDYRVDGCDAYGMTNEQAETLFEFLDSHIGCDFYMHCSAGVSRSQAVARFLMDFYYDTYVPQNQYPGNPCLIPNLHVVSLLRREWLHKYYRHNIENVL